MNFSDLAYAEFIELIAAGTTPAKLIAFQPSDAARTRVAGLIQRQKGEGLSDDDKEELEQFLEIEHIVRLAKARARQNLG